MIIDTTHTKAQKALCIQKIADKPMELARAGNDLMMKNITVNLKKKKFFFLKFLYYKLQLFASNNYLTSKS